MIPLTDARGLLHAGPSTRDSSMKNPREISQELIMKALSPVEVREYAACRNVRVEILEVGSKLVAYTVKGRTHVIHDIIQVDDLSFNPDTGFKLVIGSETQALEEDVGIIPIKPFDLPIFIHLPVNPGFRWHPHVTDLTRGVMSFPLVV